MSAARAVARLRLTRAAVAIILLAGLGATALPLVSVPGYELAEVLTVLATLLGSAVGLASVRTPEGRQWPSRAALSAGGFTVLGVAGAVLVTTVGDLLGRRCSPWPGLPFVLLLPVPSAFLAGALGGLCGLAFRRAWFAALACLALLLGNLVGSVWPLYAGPQVFAYSHLFGWFPGPLYDELLTPPRALWMFRALTLVAAAATLGALSCLETRRPLPRLVATAALLGLFAVGVALEHRFGAATSVADIDQALGGRRVATGLVLHYPAELPPADIERLTRAAELDVNEVSRALGLPTEPPVDVFFYRNAAEKGRLTGASSTHFTKPWLRQIHTHADAEGLQVLRHELVHALAAPLGRPPFDVCARLFGVDVQAGIVEGLAMAVDWPADELTLHQWARAMREAKLAPDIRTIVGPAGFLSQAQGRAYTLAGSFLRWLLDRGGPARVARLYRDGDFQAAYGQSLDALASAWERFVDAVPLDPEAKGAAQNRFHRGSVFAQPCAREMAELRAQVASAGQPLLQAKLLTRCAAIDPGDPSVLEALWNAQSAAGLPQAAETVTRLLASPALDPVTAARVRFAWGNDAAERGRKQLAAFNYQMVLAAHADRPTLRAVQILLAALSLPPEALRALAAYLDPRKSDPAAFAGVLELWQAHPDFAPAAYLVGLRLGEDGEREKALPYFAKALAAPGGLSPEAAAEALRRTVGWDIDLGRYDDAAAQLEKLAALNRPPAEETLRWDLARRLDFERHRYGQGIPDLR